MEALLSPSIKSATRGRDGSIEPIQPFQTKCKRGSRLLFILLCKRELRNFAVARRMYLQGIFGGVRRAILEEHELFVYLAEYNLRLEQERISQTYALKQLEVAQSSAVLSHRR